jgi:hypothetical protein
VHPTYPDLYPRIPNHHLNGTSPSDKEQSRTLSPLLETTSETVQEATPPEKMAATPTMAKYFDCEVDGETLLKIMAASAYIMSHRSRPRPYASHPIHLRSRMRSLRVYRARKAALRFNAIYVCSATTTKIRTAAYSPRTGTYYDVRTRQAENQQQREPLSFDSDSVSLTVDNCASASVTSDVQDFIAPPRASRTRIIGVNGVSSATLVGTVRWRIEDDDGKIHSIILPNTYYSREAPYRLPITPTLESSSR